MITDVISHNPCFRTGYDVSNPGLQSFPRQDFDLLLSGIGSLRFSIPSTVFKIECVKGSHFTPF